MSQSKVQPAEGKLAVLFPGMGAVATTTIAGALLVRRGLGEPVGSFTQLGRLRPPGASRALSVQDALPLQPLDRVEFGGWDLFPDDAYQSAVHAQVLEARHLDSVREELERVRPMKAAFFPEYVRRLNGTHVKVGRHKAELVEQLREDIRGFMRERGCARAVMVWCGSTEVYTPAHELHRTARAFTSALEQNHPAITPSQLYAWAALHEGVPFANGAPNLTVDFPAAVEVAREHAVPIAGKDFKTGQTMLKTVVAPALKARLLGVRGWFSTNILGNRDGQVLDDPESFRSKELSKLGVLEHIFEPDRNACLYGNLTHKVCIEYYPPRGDAKEGWDNVDLFGWLGYPMQLKLNFLCRDSILAAPIALDLALLLDLAARAGRRGTQDWLGFFFKSPMAATGGAVEHDLFAQRTRLEAVLGELACDARTLRVTPATPLRAANVS